VNENKPVAVLSDVNVPLNAQVPDDPQTLKELPITGSRAGISNSTHPVTAPPKHEKVTLSLK
jgi:hypothetical protein